MKRKIIIIAALAAATFTGCKKESSTSNITAENLAAAPVPSPTPVPSSSAGLIYHLSAGPQDINAPLIWESGEYLATDIHFSGQTKSGQLVKRSAQANIYNNLWALTEIGKLSIPTGTYGFMEFVIRMAPSAASPALVLHGTYVFSSGEKVGVEWSVNEPLVLTGTKTDVVDIIANNYNARLHFLFDGIIKGTDEESFKAADRRDEVVHISDKENSGLYFQMMDNMKSSKSLVAVVQ